MCIADDRGWYVFRGPGGGRVREYICTRTLSLAEEAYWLLV